MKKILAVMMACALVFLLAACGNNDSASGDSGSNGNKKEIKELTMGFVPSQEADQIADTVKPLSDYLSKKLGVPVKAQVMTDFSGLVEGMRSGTIDIGFTNPFGYVQAADRANAEVLVKAIRLGSDTYRAQFVVSANSKLKSVDDIAKTKGLKWAYPDPLSTSGYLFPGSLLMDKGVKNLETFYTQQAAGGHDSAVLAVYNGQADFATTFEDARTVVKKDAPDVMDKLKVIGYTDKIPNDGVSVSKDMPEEWKTKIKNAFMSINDDKEALKVMNDVYSWDGVAEATDKDYDIVRTVYERFKDKLE
ncbi:phosphate/phosphite/phosphonate ABC transporter substrate-binding protein [Sporolactobacillus sp. Y61]|uniref:Phosphate/phosphite/phosphonate ABC transporter substrate-binding protein n=1 Tax=Sporolactobacillus sp. Y61 TaxID=3160863 RepID=A0AAU8IGI8_9BACL